jgi:hypothetical protein
MEPRRHRTEVALTNEWISGAGALDKEAFVNRRRSTAVLAGALLMASGPAHVVQGQPAPPSTSGASVLEWNARAAQLIVGPGGAAKAPPLGLVDLARSRHRRAEGRRTFLG